MSEERPISVRIMDIEYRVACPPDEEPDLRTAAEQLNRTMADVRETGKVMGTERVAVMAALNISYELLTLKRQFEALEDTLRGRTRQLIEQVDTALRHFEDEAEAE
ncbi:MAG: cell division protein ZapA [Candidatus Competibacterales bacterium]|nr:cell division protein ZapA [Candidatus Competibacterales bacterium]